MNIDRQAFWLWLLQRISAALILAALSVHLYQVHYANLGEPILYADVKIRMKYFLYWLADASLLGLGLFHGLNGVRAILLDFTDLAKQERRINWVLLILGAIFFLQGARVLWVFLIK